MQFRQSPVTLALLLALAPVLTISTHANAVEIFQETADKTQRGERFKQALETAQNGAVIQLEGDTALLRGSGYLTINKNITIEGNGHQLHIEGSNLSLEADVTIKNTKLSLKPSQTLDNIFGSGFNTQAAEPSLIVTNGHKLILDAVDTTTSGAHPDSRPIVMLGSKDDSTQNAGHGELVVTNSNYKTKLFAVVAGGNGSNDQNQPTKITLEKGVSFVDKKSRGTDESVVVGTFNGKNYTGDVDLVIGERDSNLTNFNTTTNPNVSLTLTDGLGGNGILKLGENGTLKNLTLDGPKSVTVENLTVTDKLTLKNGAVLQTPNFPTATSQINLNNVMAESGEIKTEEKMGHKANLNISGNIEGNLKITGKDVKLNELYQLSSNGQVELKTPTPPSPQTPPTTEPAVQPEEPVAPTQPELPPTEPTQPPEEPEQPEQPPQPVTPEDPVEQPTKPSEPADNSQGENAAENTAETPNNAGSTEMPPENSGTTENNENQENNQSVTEQSSEETAQEETSKEVGHTEKSESEENKGESTPEPKAQEITSKPTAYSLISETEVANHQSTAKALYALTVSSQAMNGISERLSRLRSYDSHQNLIASLDNVAIPFSGESGLWVSTQSQRLKQHQDYKLRHWGVQIGYDGSWSTESGLMRLGGAVDVANGQIWLIDSYDELRVQDYGVSLYGAYETEKGQHIDAIARVARISVKNPVQHFRYHNHLSSASLAYGQRFQVTPYWVVDPYGQLAYHHLGAADYRQNQLVVKRDAVNSLVASLGVKSAVQIKPNLQLYFDATLYRELAGKQKLFLTHDAAPSDMVRQDWSNKATWGVIGVGIQSKWTSNLYWSTELNHVIGNGYKQSYQAQFNVNWLF